MSSQNENTETEDRKRLSVKDFGILVGLATTSASLISCAVFGVDTIVEKCTTFDLWEILFTIMIYALLIGTLTYVLLRIAAHYLVYLAFSVLTGIIFPCSPSRARKLLQRIFSRQSGPKVD